MHKIILNDADGTVEALNNDEVFKVEVRSWDRWK
jgi:hypothetical protein